MTKLPLVSIIIPVLNGEEFILRAISSAEQQTHPNIEIIVIDDCSNDKTQEIVWAHKSSRNLIYHRNEKNMNVSFSRNKGMSLAKGEFINFLDADDWLDRSKIQLQLEKFATSKVENLGFVTCHIRINYSNNFVIKYNSCKNNIYKKMITRYAHWGTLAPLIKADVLKNFDFDENLYSTEDYDFFLRASKIFGFDYVDESLCTVDNTKSGISNNTSKRLQATYQLIKKHKKTFFLTSPKATLQNIIRLSVLLIILELGKLNSKISINTLKTITRYR